MEMLDGTEVVRVVGASGAGPVAERGVWIGANAGSAAEAGDGYPADAMGGEEEGHVWGEWDSGGWVEGTGIDSRTGAEAEEAVVAAAEAVAGAGARTEEVEAVVEVGARDDSRRQANSG